MLQKPRYGPHKTKIIMKQVRVVLDNDLISKFFSSGWGSPVVLASKSHQEHINDVEEFIWRICISYRGLNIVTNLFEYPIGRCDDDIEDVGDGTHYIWFISVDSAQGYHQIRVWACDKDKLAFFAPDDEKYTWEVIPFGPTNTPTFFTVKTRVMQREAMALFCIYCNQVELELHRS